MAGIMPLVSRKNAMFIAKQMPGMNVPDYIVDKYNENMSREESEQVAIDISLDIAEKLKDCCDGYYFMTPFNRVNLICNIIDELNNIEVIK
jgi:homocysteine S-methyltransferase